MNRSLTALALVGALLVGGAVAAAPASAAEARTRSYHSVPFLDDLILVDGDGNPEDTVTTIATFSEWRADGFPAPTRESATFFGSTWSPVVYAEIALPDYPVSLPISYGEWQRAGSPRPVTTRLSSTAGVYKWASSSEVFSSIASLSRSVGRTEFTDHKLTFDEYRHLGSPALAEQPGEGNVFYASSYVRKLPWLPSIVIEDTRNVQGELLSYDSWASYAYPTPQVVKSFPGDRYCMAAGSPDITYSGYAAPDGVKMTYSQWVAAGSPRPTTC
ncbi:hypothetical protein JOE38_000556 [Clavibacter michiganensis]|uniref:hypothetical protein n=1 Tax=Clavibacter michiganensis TaxID=28447 RepID=UPI00195D4A90|nr:hypothetical protein [Clavibacter michiganensis]MBM7410733.1 hypothetical protein [Clavibacter michiganensis]